MYGFVPPSLNKVTKGLRPNILLKTLVIMPQERKKEREKDVMTKEEFERLPDGILIQVETGWPIVEGGVYHLIKGKEFYRGDVISLDDDTYRVSLMSLGVPDGQMFDINIKYYMTEVVIVVKSVTEVMKV